MKRKPEVPILKVRLSSLRAWTTGVSNPICSPRFRPSRSGFVSKGAFASGVPSDLLAFYRSTRNSPLVDKPLASFHLHEKTKALHFFNESRSLHFSEKRTLRSVIVKPPTDPLRPVIPKNACPLRLTAAAGTELAGTSFIPFTLER